MVRYLNLYLIITLDRLDINSIDEVSKSAFSQRRKKIKNNMRNYIEIIEKLSIDQNLRPENLSVLDYCEVAKNI